MSTSTSSNTYTPRPAKGWTRFAPILTWLPRYDRSWLRFVIYKSSRPHLSSLGRVPGNIPVPGVLVLRLDGPLHYANALTVRIRVKLLVEEADPPPRAVIFEAAAQDELDLTSADILKGLVKELHARNMAVYFADVHAPVIEFSRRTGLHEIIGEENVFPSLEEAVRFSEKKSS